MPNLRSLASHTSQPDLANRIVDDFEEATAPTKLVFDKPTKSDPGFLRRAIHAGKVKQSFKDGDPAPLLEFFLDYVTSHEREDARAILLELSEDDFDAKMRDLMDAFEGKANSPAAQSNGSLTKRSAPARGRKRTGV